MARLPPQFGFIFDIDGVFLRGGRVIDRAKQALARITDAGGNFLVPTLFVTNAGNMTRHEKTRRLNSLLDSRISADQIVMSHSPLRLFTNLHQRHILGSGQNVIQIAKHLGFQKVSTVDDVNLHFPSLDALNYHLEEESAREKKVQKTGRFERIEAIVLFEEPTRWETNLQLIIDLIMMNGDLNGQRPPENVPKLPVIACSKDLIWMSEATLPRFAHGSFLFALETLYQQIAGKPLQYYAILGKPSPITYAYAEWKLHEQARSWSLTAKSSPHDVSVKRLYCVGDNLETDVCGANLYNHMAAAARRRHSSASTKRDESKANVKVSPSASEYEAALPDLDSMLPASRIDECVSILVRTGVSSFQSSRIRTSQSLANESDKETEVASEFDWVLTSERHRKLMRMREFSTPRYVLNDVHDAVELVLELEAKHKNADAKQFTLEKGASEQLSSAQS